jgi:hypothetical protein
MSFDLEDSFGDFLKKARKHNLFCYAINLEDFIFEKYYVKGLTREQIYSMPLKDLWLLIKDYKSKGNRHFWIRKN